MLLHGASPLVANHGIGDGDRQRVGRPLDAEARGAARAVPHGVREGLLHDPVDGEAHARQEGSRRARVLPVDAEAGAAEALDEGVDVVPAPDGTHVRVGVGGRQEPPHLVRAARLVSEMVRNMRDASGLGAVARPLSAWTMTLVRVCASTSCMSSLMR